MWLTGLICVCCIGILLVQFFNFYKAVDDKKRETGIKVIEEKIKKTTSQIKEKQKELKKIEDSNSEKVKELEVWQKEKSTVEKEIKENS